MSQASLGFGVIEGFYGRPWSHAARVSMLETLAALELDTYLFAPKNDPHHRSSWFKPLALEERGKLRELFDAGRSLGVKVVYGLAPERILGGSGNVGRSSWRRRDTDHDGLADASFGPLRDRLLELTSLGCRSFALAFDDTWTTFLPAFATFEKGLLHARVAHRALSLVRESAADAEVFLVPAIYHRRIEDMPGGALSYLRGLATLGADIPAAWTGPNIFSRLIEPGDVLRLERAIGLPVWIWNNAITNDWLPVATGEPLGLRPLEKLSFGPPENIGPGLARVTRGIMLNGAREPELTKVSLACLAELKSEGPRYDPSRAHERALDRVFGPEAAPAASKVYDLTKRHPLSSPFRFEGAKLHDLVADFVDGRGGRRALERSMNDLGALEGVLEAALGDRPIFGELGPTLKRVTLMVDAARLALERAAAVASGDALLADALGRTLRGLVASGRGLRWELGLEPLARLVGMSPSELVKRL